MNRDQSQGSRREGNLCTFLQEAKAIQSFVSIHYLIEQIGPLSNLFFLSIFCTVNEMAAFVLAQMIISFFLKTTLNGVITRSGQTIA